MESGQTGKIGEIVPSHVEEETKLELEYVTAQSRPLGERTVPKMDQWHLRTELAIQTHVQVKQMPITI